MEENKNYSNEDYEAENQDEEADVNGESKADKFKRLAVKRTNDTLKAISRLGKLASPSYEYAPDQVQKIFDTLQKALDDNREKFTIKEKEEEQEFTL